MTLQPIWLTEDSPPGAFPDVEFALTQPNGLLAVGGDLGVERLLSAYRRGIFPWFSEGQPILWWAPDPRAVLFPEGLRVSRSLSKSLRNRGYEVTRNRALGCTSGKVNTRESCCSSIIAVPPSLVRVRLCLRHRLPGRLPVR